MNAPMSSAIEIELEGSKALLQRPEGARALLVLAHGAGAGMRHAVLEALSDRLADRGVATLRYEFPYMARGQKRIDKPEVLHTAVRAAVQRGAQEGLPLYAGGKSMGGRMTTQAAALEPLPGVRGLVLVGFPLHGAGQEPNTKRAEHLTTVKLPMLFLQGTRDELCDLSLLGLVLEPLQPPPALHVEEGADHSFHVLKRSGRTDAQVLDALAERIAAFTGAQR
jgi:predicted alpha/beta-hydrolase family hydrolase